MNYQFIGCVPALYKMYEQNGTFAVDVPDRPYFTLIK